MLYIIIFYHFIYIFNIYWIVSYIYLFERFVYKHLIIHLHLFIYAGDKNTKEVMSACCGPRVWDESLCVLLFRKIWFVPHNSFAFQNMNVRIWNFSFFNQKRILQMTIHLCFINICFCYPPCVNGNDDEGPRLLHNLARLMCQSFILLPDCGLMA